MGEKLYDLISYFNLHLLYSTDEFFFEILSLGIKWDIKRKK